VILKDENEDLTSGQEQRLRRMEREYERRQQVVFSLYMALDSNSLNK
jgi:hypothetical protein